MSHVSKVKNKCYASKYLVNVLDFKKTMPNKFTSIIVLVYSKNNNFIKFIIDLINNKSCDLGDI